MIAGKKLQQTVRRFWTERFDLRSDAWDIAGTHVRCDDAFKDSDEIYIYELGECRVLRMDAGKFERLDLPDDLPTRAMNSGEFVALARGVFEIEMGQGGINHYLEPERFRPVPEVAEFPIRRIDPVADDDVLRELIGACSEEDIDAAEIYLDKPDPVIFGSFRDDRMVAYASHRYWGENIADIGVLTHPEFRHSGLGKAVVSRLCQWCIDNDVIAMYRVESEHFRSRKIAEVLGFDPWMLIEVMNIRHGRE